MRKINGPTRVFLRGAAILLLSFGVCVICFSCEKDSKMSEIPSSQQSVSESQQQSTDAVDSTFTAEPDALAGGEVMKRHQPRSDERLEERHQMVRVIEQRHGLKDRKVLEAMLNVPRHWFVPKSEQSHAYWDSPLPIGHGQTISQPFIVAYMTSLLKLDADKKVLEIGTGSGYQAAILTEFTPYVYSIEIVEELGRAAEKLFPKLGYETIKVKVGDGYKGWPEYAPFDAIIVTCAPERIPSALLEQLKPNGRMIIPVGGSGQIQDMILVTKDEKSNSTKKSSMPVRFVPMVREK